jgi:hypothetical protein
MDFKIDIRLMILVFTVAATLGGFYYTTQLRLDTIEAKLEAPAHDCPTKKQVQNLSKRVKRLESK